MIEPIELPGGFQESYRKALRTGVESYMMNVSGYSLERVREDRRQYLAGYNIFAEKQERQKPVFTPEPTYRKGVHYEARPCDLAFASALNKRRVAAGLNIKELSALARTSSGHTCEILSGRCRSTQASRDKLLEAMRLYEGIRSAFSVAAE